MNYTAKMISNEKRFVELVLKELDGKNNVKSATKQVKNCIMEDFKDEFKSITDKMGLDDSIAPQLKDWLADTVIEFEKNRCKEGLPMYAGKDHPLRGELDKVIDLRRAIGE